MSDELAIEDVVGVLNEKGHNSVSNWRVEIVFGESIVRCDSVYYTLTAFEARAVAREYLRLNAKPTLEPTTLLIDEVASVLQQLDQLAEVWGDEGVFRRCRDRLRAAIQQAKGE